LIWINDHFHFERLDSHGRIAAVFDGDAAPGTLLPARRRL